jgi:hypothetical protein
VTVFNDGSVPAHLEEVGVICADKRRETALVSEASIGRWILVPVNQAGLGPIESKSAETFTIYLRAGSAAFTPKRAFAVDKTGKEWRSRVR